MKSYIKDILEEIKQTIIGLAVLFLISFVIMTFLIQTSATPTKSMYPSVKKGEMFLLSKISYGWNLHNCFMGITNNNLWRNIFSRIPKKRIFALTDIQYGDIVSFRQNSDYSTKFLKRVVGLPGDIVQMKSGTLYLNDKPVKKCFLREKERKNKKGKITVYSYFEETLPNGKKFMTRYIKGAEDYVSNNTEAFQVPSGFIFAMGDNRDRSGDSRGHVGLVPINNVFGKAIFCIFSKSNKNKIFTTDIKLMVKSIFLFFKSLRLKRMFKPY